MNHFDDLFLQAREISDPAARAAFLDEACAHQPELRARLDALLADASAADAFFGEDDTIERVSQLVPPQDQDATSWETRFTPTHIGPYRILERIGHGGMGDVFRAVQKEPIRREVALKLIKLGMDTQQVIARFEAERQALALMDHPHIARVLDAGADDLGHPYFVMELVRGVPITQYADEKQLTLRERLSLMQQVCQAIQHAHSKGVIHRDLKPSNILVSTQDGRPHAKVIDFGIAKATAQPLTDKTLFTQFQQFIGTPQYMSPEQAEGSLDIDTRSDVYALGILLYELLTGGTPVEAATLRQAALHEIARIIKEQDTPKPSTRLLNVGVLARARGSRSEKAHDPRVLANAPTAPVGAVARLRSSGAEATPKPHVLADAATPTTLASLAKARSISSEALIKTVRGELDWLVMKALEKDRARRYETPNQLSDDIARYLEGQPIVAAPPSSTYRMKKFIRKHRAPVLAAAAVLTLMTAGILGTSWGLVREKAAKDEATQQAKIADQERTRAEAEKAEAQKQKAEADQQRLTAETAKTTAEREREAAELESYIGNLAAAQAALTAHDYPGARARLAVCPEKLRGWEWRFIQEKAKAMLCVLDRSIQPLKFTPDGIHIVAYNAIKRALRFYDMEGKSSSPFFAIPDLDSLGPNPDQVQFSKDGSIMLYVCEGSHENGIIIVETATGKRLLSMPSNPPNGWPSQPQLSPDGQMFALSNTAQIGHVDGSLVSVPAQKGRNESRLFVDKDFTSVVVATDNTAQLMNLAGELISEQIVLDKHIYRAKFNRDGSRFLLQTTSQTHLYNRFGQQIGAPIPSSMFIDRIGFSPDGKYIVVPQKDKLGLFHSENGSSACTLKLSHDLSNQSLSSNALHWDFSENGGVLVARLDIQGENSSVQAWELPSGKSILTKMPARDYLDVIISPTGSQLVTYSAYEGTDLRLPRRFELEFKSFNPLLEPYRWDNDSILVTDEYRSKIRRELSGPGGLCLWNSEGHLLASIDSWYDKYSMLIGPSGGFIASKDGKKLIAKSENGSPVLGFQSFGSPVWKIRDRSRKEILDAWIEVPHDIPATSDSNDVYLETCIEAAFQQDRLLKERDSLKLATQEASDSMVIRAKALMDDLKNRDAIYSVSVSNDGQRIYAATDRQLIVWSVAAGREIARFHTDLRVQHIAMSDDDSRMILSFVDGSAQIWDSRPFVERQRFYEVLSAEQAECERIFEKIWDPTAPIRHLCDLIESDEHLTKLKKLVVISLLESAHERKTREANFKLKESK
jgi:serine/threonine protein kinase/WD40 repeat protein